MSDKGRMKAMILRVDCATGRQPRPVEQRLQGSEVSETVMVDNVEESKPPRASEDVDHDVDADMPTHAETQSYGARLRMIILLSLACWALIIAGVAAIAG